MKKQMYAIIRVSVVLLITAILFSCGSGGGSDGDNPTSESLAVTNDWTIIAYLDGNIDLDKRSGINSSFILDELQDFEEIGSTDHVQIVAL